MDVNKKFINLHKSLMTLTHDQCNGQDRQTKLQRILTASTSQLGVDRASIWSLSENKTFIFCEILYNSQSGKIEKGLQLFKKHYPNYFEAILENKFIDANDARHDPRTNEFTESYLEPLGIYSMLDAPIFSAGEFWGILCLEHTGSRKDWDIAEISYAASIADTVSLLNEQEAWQKAREELEFAEQIDSLTGLENRRFFQQRLERETHHPRKRNQLRALALYGINGFSDINDNYGARAADQLLTVLANRFQQLSKTSICWLSRLEGDTFGFWLPAPQSREKLDETLQNILITAKQSIQINDGEVISLEGCMGVVTYPAGEILTDPIRRAEIAMQKAKQQPGSHIKHFSESWLEELTEHKTLENELHQAFEQDQFKVHYQPLLSNDTGKIAGIEALVRWYHPDKGLITPFHFLPLITRMGLMNKLGSVVLRQACLDIKRLHKLGIEIDWVSVNLAADQLYNPQLADEIKSLLKEIDLENRHLELEIVEELISQDSEQVRLQVEAIAALGIKLSIDDFGTGYSSLSRLKHLPVSKLKIDKSFVDGIPESKDDKIIARSIIGLAKAMHLDIVAEGVEREDQESWLITNGCDYLQGYLYERPIPLADIISQYNKTSSGLTSNKKEADFYNLSLSGNIITISGNYLWDDSVIEGFGKDLLGLISSSGLTRWAHLNDIRKWRSVTPEAQNVFINSVDSIINKGLAREAFVTGYPDSANHRLTVIASGANEDHKRCFFKDKESALAWLKEEGFEP
jgi:diguanylate cyclase (GGDEF)-like protein